MEVAHLPKIHFVDSYDEVVNFFNWLSQRHAIIAVDTETTGLEWWRSDSAVKLVQFGDTEEGWSIPCHRWSGVAEEALRRYTGPIVMHNAPFDVTWMRKVLGINVKYPEHDTQVLARLYQPHMSKALKSTAKRLVDTRAMASQTALSKGMKDNGWDWATVPVHYTPYWAYAAIDTVLTARVWVELVKQIGGYVTDDVYQLELQVGRMITDIQYKGMRIDPTYCMQMSNGITNFETETRAWARDVYGIKNFTSNAQLAKALMAHGVDLTELTSRGAWKLDKTILSSIDHDIAQAALALRKALKLRSTYFDNLLSMRDNDNWVHSSIDPLGARTGRMSVRTPALQTLPRGPQVRDAFVADDADSVLVSVDFDQIEIRLLAHYSGAQSLLDAIAEGDVHTATARRVYRDDSIGKHDPRRQTSKNAVFAKVYCAGVDKFAKTAGIDVESAQEFLDMYDRTFPEVPEFMDDMITDAEQQIRNEGIARAFTKLGRMQVPDNIRAYSIINHLIQGTAADVFKQAMCRLQDAGYGEYIRMLIHDEIIFCFPRDEAQDLSDEVVEIMTDRDWATPLTVEASEPLERWGQKYGSTYVPAPLVTDEGLEEEDADDTW